MDTLAAYRAITDRERARDILATVTDRDDTRLGVNSDSGPDPDPNVDT